MITKNRFRGFAGGVLAHSQVDTVLAHAVRSRPSAATTVWRCNLASGRLELAWRGAASARASGGTVVEIASRTSMGRRPTVPSRPGPAGEEIASGDIPVRFGAAS